MSDHPVCTLFLKPFLMTKKQQLLTIGTFIECTETDLSHAMKLAEDILTAKRRPLRKLNSRNVLNKSPILKEVLPLIYFSTFLLILGLLKSDLSY